MSEKTPPKTAPGRRKPKHGKGELLTGGMPGNKGGGRPRNDEVVPFRTFMQNIRDDPAARTALHEAAKDAESKAFGIAWKYATEYDPEKPAERHEVVVGLSKLLADLE